MIYITEFGGRFLATNVTAVARRALRGALLEIAHPDDLAWEIFAEGKVVTLRPRSACYLRTPRTVPIVAWGTTRSSWQPQLQAIHAFTVELGMNLAGSLWWMGDEYGDDPDDLDAGNVVMFDQHMIVTPLPLPLGPDSGGKDNRRRARAVLGLPTEGGGLPPA